MWPVNRVVCLFAFLILLVFISTAHGRVDCNWQDWHGAVARGLHC